MEARSADAAGAGVRAMSCGRGGKSIVCSEKNYVTKQQDTLKKSHNRNERIKKSQAATVREPVVWSNTGV